MIEMIQWMLLLNIHKKIGRFQIKKFRLLSVLRNVLLDRITFTTSIA